MISRVNICAKKEHFQYRERMIEELDGDTGWHELVNLGYRDEYDQKKFFFLERECFSTGLFNLVPDCESLGIL